MDYKYIRAYHQRDDENGWHANAVGWCRQALTYAKRLGVNPNDDDVFNCSHINLIHRFSNEPHVSKEKLDEVLERLTDEFRNLQPY